MQVSTVQPRLSPQLCDIPETMLWALHERATEAKRPEGVLRDSRCIEIYDSLDYDFFGRFGQPTRRAAVRAMRVDHELRQWLSRHPSGLIVSLGEGLETQAVRIDNGSMGWLSVDLPEAIRVRERFLPPTERFRHIAMSAFDPAWMDYVDDRSGVFIVAQGLFMYFESERVRELFVRIANRFSGGRMIFDVVPRWVSEPDRPAHKLSDMYTAPTMPWGVDRDEIAPTLRSWWPAIKRIRTWRLGEPNDRPKIVEDILDGVLRSRQRQPSVVEVTF